MEFCKAATALDGITGLLRIAFARFQIAEFFKTRKPPINPEETLEVFAFMEAAEESKRRDGVPVRIEEVMLKARQSPTSLGITLSGLIKGR